MEIVQVKHGGFNVNVRMSLPWHDLNILTKLICNDEYGVAELKDVIGDKIGTILDIGGHIGGFGMLVKSLWPNARLVAIEPVKLNCELYAKNLKDNGLWDNNCYILQAAVGYNPERTCVVNSPRTTGGFMMRTKKESEVILRQRGKYYDRVIDDDVKSLTIENIFKMLNIEKVDLAKWDCEGGEVDAFLNMSNETAGKFRFMVGEYHSWDSREHYLKNDFFGSIMFWREVRRKFPHLNFNYETGPGLNAMGLFQAWPKEIN